MVTTGGRISEISLSSISIMAFASLCVSAVRTLLIQQSRLTAAC
jgi:hypothetical protein